MEHRYNYTKNKKEFNIKERIKTDQGSSVEENF
jgi:hypothetical protein